MMLCTSTTSGSPGSMPSSARIGREALAERGHLLGRVPDLTDAMLVARPEADLELEPVGREDAFLAQSTYSVVVLLGRQGRGSEADERAQGEPPCWGRANIARNWLSRWYGGAGILATCESSSRR